MQFRDLPDDLDLPLVSGEPWWYWLGGRSALDLVNTRRERWRRNVETLATPRDLARWLVAAGVTEAEASRVPRAVLREAIELREAIDAATQAAFHGHPAPPDALGVIDSWLKYSGSRRELVPGPDGAPVLGERAAADSPRRALGMIALDAAEMLGSAEARARIRICASDTCSARFYDRSPAGVRRWCSMRTCGNAAKARRHRARNRPVPAGAP